MLNDSLLSPFFTESPNSKDNHIISKSGSTSNSIQDTLCSFTDPILQNQSKNKSFHRKSQSVFSSYESKAPSMPTFVYFPIDPSIEVPIFSHKHSWKYPSGNLSGIQSCHEFQSFLNTLT